MKPNLLKWNFWNKLSDSHFFIGDKNLKFVILESRQGQYKLFLYLNGIPVEISSDPEVLNMDFPAGKEVSTLEKGMSFCQEWLNNYVLKFLEKEKSNE